jgi:hypothetical protein
MRCPARPFELMPAALLAAALLLALAQLLRACA